MSIVLTKQQEERLRRIAPWVDLGLDYREGNWHLTRSKRRRPIVLGPEAGHVRLLAEICERSLRWIGFHLDERCDFTLLRLSDAQLHRVAELRRLYLALREDMGCDDDW
jgi:hypothetical protein